MGDRHPSPGDTSSDASRFERISVSRHERRRNRFSRCRVLNDLIRRRRGIHTGWLSQLRDAVYARPVLKSVRLRGRERRRTDVAISRKRPDCGHRGLAPTRPVIVQVAERLAAGTVLLDERAERGQMSALSANSFRPDSLGKPGKPGQPGRAPQH
jgi:hypothetical protein